MQRLRFAFVSNSGEVGASVVRGADPSIEEVHLNLATMERAIPVARELLDGGVEAVIGGGGTGHLLAKCIGQPIITLPRSPIEILLALMRARQNAADVALTSFAGSAEGMELYEELLSTRIRPIVFSSSEELGAGITHAVEDGCRIIVGGGICRELAVSCGVQGVVVVPREQSVRQTLKDARALALVRRNERRHAEELRAVAGVTGEGFIILDANERVKMFNDAAGAIFGPILRHTTPQDLIGQRLTGEFETIGLRRVLNSGKPEAERTCRVGDVEISVAVRPITVEGEIAGVIARVREAPAQPVGRRTEGRRRHKGFVARHSFDQISGGTDIQTLIARAGRYASTEASILIEGETGSGKELMAQGLHNASKRRDQPFLAVNCASLSESLLESELFGYDDGAFTGARRGGKAGLFELADKGTLFLDEVADITPNLQVRLLRVLEEKEIMRLGGDRIIPIDVRVISSSQRNLFAATQEARFRLDLYFRIATLRLEIPPLRARTEDIPSLLATLFAKHGLKINIVPTHVSNFLREYDWPGNVRELESLVRTYLALAETNIFDPGLFTAVFREQQAARRQLTAKSSNGATPLEKGTTLKEQLRRHEEEIIRRTLEQCHHNRTKTADLLGISVNSLWRKSQGFVN